MTQVVLYSPKLGKLCGGDIASAVFLGQILYWFAPSKNGGSKLKVCKDGQMWLAKSVKEWAEELGTSPDKVRRCMQVLKDKGIIETGLYKFDGAPTTHLRLVVDVTKCNSLEALIHLVSSPNSFGAEPESLTYTTTETTAEKALAPEQEMKAADIIKHHAQMKAGVEKVNPSILWKKEVSSHFPGFVKELTMQEKGQLSKAMKTLGEAAPDVLRTVVARWGEFGNLVCVETGTKGFPERPHVGYFLKYCDVAMRLHKKPVQSIAVHVPAPSPTIEEEHVDKDEIADILKQAMQ